MKTSEKRFLTTHAGSLPRSRELDRLHIAHSRGDSVDPSALAEEALASTRAVIERQREVGIDIANNGEQARESFFTYVQHRMTGYSGTSNRPPFQDMVQYPSWLELKLGGYGDSVSLTAAPQARGEVTYTNREPLDRELKEFQSLLDELAPGFIETFVTAPSPGIIAAAMENVFYDDLDAYIDALGRALRVEYQAIVDAGHLLQLDCPDLAMERHAYFGERSDEEFVAFADKVIATLGASLEGVPKDRVRMHVCWGNYDGPHDCDVELATILPSLEKAPVGALMLALANPRHAHEVRLLASSSLPADLVIVAGVIDTTSNYVEHPEVVADRIERVAEKLGDPRRVIAGTDCGFETSAGFRDVAEEVAWAKLASLVEGAAIASQRCF